MTTRLGPLVILGIVALLATAPVFADPGDSRSGRRMADRVDEGDTARAERIERIHAHRRGDSRFGRMSPEERRQLRLDIRAAREGVYRRPPPAPLPPGLQEEPPR